jgi:hypothetical protein
MIVNALDLFIPRKHHYNALDFFIPKKGILQKIVDHMILVSSYTNTEKLTTSSQYCTTW